MANESHLSYGKNTIALKTAPLAGENINVYLRPGDELKSSIDLSKAQYQIVGTDVVATLPNGGKITFVSLGMMVFEDNPPIIKLPNDDRLLVTDILNKVQNISQASKDSILTSGDVILQSDEKSDSAAASKKSDDPVVDYNAYYVDPQPNIKPQDEIGPKDNVGKYLTESPSFTSNETSNATSTQSYSSSETQSHSKDNIADVSAALTFDIGFYQIKSTDSTASSVTTVLGGTGSALGNVSKLASAQFEPETIDYRNNPNVQVITADDPKYVTETFLTKLVRMSISQPIGFGITEISILGLSSGFQILNMDGTSLNSVSGGWNLSAGTGFSSTATDGGEIIEFYVKYEPANVTVNTDYLMKVSLTSIFDMNNVPPLMQSGVVVPILDTLTSVKDVGVIVKTVESISDYTYTGQYPSGFVLDTTPNENIIYTGKHDSTVYGGLSNDTIYGNIGNDMLNGDKGNDTLSGGAGTNTLDGGDGTADTVSYDFVTKYSDDFIFANGAAIDPATGLAYANDAKGVIVDLQAASATGKTVYDATADATTGESLLAINDTLSAVEYVIGSKYDDTIRGDSGNNKLMGGEGNDTLEGRGGADWLDGGAGNDWLIGSTNDYMIDGGDNNDTVDFSSNSNGIEVTLNNSANGTIKNIGAAVASTIIKNVENVAGTQYKDIMTGDNSNNLLIGGYDHLAVAVTAADDTIIGGAGADTIVGDVMIDSVIAGDIYAGSDVLTGGSENDIIYGDSAPIRSTSTITVTADQSVEYVIDTIDGLLATVHGGNDTLQGGAGDDYLNAGSGFDTVDYSSSTAKVVVNLGLSGSAGSATGEGTDQLYNIENIIGSNYGDTLAGNELANTINGGIGSDWVDYGYASSGVSVDLSMVGLTGSAIVGGGGDADALISIENVFGSSYDDNITDKSGTANTLLGLNGNDIFFSHNNNTGGTDTYDGGNGTDTIDYSLYSGNLHVTLGGSTNIDTLINIENITGTAGNDTLVGDTNGNLLKGMDGADTLMGGAGADTLDGGVGQDMADYSTSNSITVNLTAGTVIDGLGSTDTLTSIEIVKGSNAADIMTGSLLSDTLIGSSGNDTFFASSGSDIYYGNDTLNSADANSNGDKVDYSVAIAGVDNIFADLSSNSVYLRAGAATVSTDTLNSIEEVYGTTGNDTMIGKYLSVNTLSGGDGNDILTGNTDGDVLDGGSGTNVADYSARTQNLTADLSLTSKNIYITGTTPSTTNSDTLINLQNLTTGSGNDKLTGNSADNILTGGAGNDTFIGGAGNDTFIGGTSSISDSGNDTADYSASITAIDADLTRASGQVIGNASTDGTDTFYGIENIIGTAQNDTVIGDANVNILTGGSGDDTLTGNGGADQLYGGIGNDTIYGGYDGDYIDGGNGASERNTIDYSGFIDDATVNLTTSQAYLNEPSPLIDSVNNIQNVVAGSGNDMLIGKSGVVNTLSGGAGNDILTGNLDGDLLDGQADTTGDTADYSAYTSSTNITVDMGALSIAQSGSSTAKDYFTNIEKIQTGAGADTFTVNTAFDTGTYTLDGGAGIDIIDYSSISETINVSLNGGTYTNVIVGAALGNDEVIKNIEDVSGSKANDIITGDALNNKLYGNEGADTLDGGAGSDLVYGGDGNDLIIGTIDGVADSYYGGNVSTDTGTADRIDYTAVTANMTLSAGITVTDSTNSIGTDSLSGIEIFDSGSGNDSLSGGTAGMTIYGNLGIDKITGGSGNDLLYGDNVGNTHAGADGSNTLAGGAGNDTLYAGGSGDTLRGDAGNDTMFGGIGIDTLDYVTNNIAITALLNTGIINGDGSDVIDTATIEILRSGSGADVITGADTGVLKTIYTGIGNDVINGGALDEVIYGEAGNDTIRGGDGIDTIYGGANNDLIYGGIDGDTVYGGSESDTLDFSDILATNLVIDMSNQSTTVGTVNINASTFSEIENITGGSGNDQITGDTNANTLKGSAGNDTIFTSDGIDFIDGGSGTADVVDFSAIRTAAVNVNLSTLQIINDGYGKAETIQNIEIINGGNYTTAGDTLYGDGMDNIIYGNLGADQLSGNDGADILYGDNATNSNGVGDGHNIINGDAGNDTLYAGNSGDTLSGGSGADKLNGAVGADTLVGGSGDDRLDGGGGTDVADYRSATAKVVITSISPANPNDTTDLTTGVLSGTEGTDIITNTVEVIYGSSGYGDTMTGNANANIFYGWGGNDTLSGGLGNDTIYGGTGDDIVAGDGGNDLLVGGDIIGTLAGWDTVDYSTDIAGIALNLTTGTATDGSGGTDTLSGFSKVLGSNFADTITGNVGADDLRGGGGDDWLVMSAGNDTIYGGTTTETTGDTVDFIAATTAGVIVNLATNNASGTDIGTDVIYEVENVSGSNFADTITGNANANTLVGRALNDTIVAGSGADVIYGDDNVLDANFDGIQTGNDSLYGQDGNDTMHGGLGNDSLWGGNNDDTLYGGTGSDYINGENGINVLFGNDGNDTFELNVTTATNTITGGSGTDTLYFYNAAAVTINLATLSSAQATGGGGSVMLIDSTENIVGSNSGGDVITGNSLANVISANGGNDLVYGAGGVDIIYGGSGADSLYGDTAGVTATDGGNTIYGGEGNDTLYGGYGNDFLYGDDGGSYGTSCNDTFKARSGSDGFDAMDGGQGTDTADYTAVSNNISVTLAGAAVATVTVTGGNNDTVVNVENFIGGSGNDNIIGDGNWNSINGGAGNDTLLGGGGNDVLTDITGINTFAGGTGNDTITGNGATSWLDYSIDGIAEGATTDLRTASGQAISGVRGSDTIASIHNITGSAYNDNFSGNASVNTIYGGVGDDIIEGYGGSDILDGGTGTDTVTYFNENKIFVTLNDTGTSSVGVWNSGTSSYSETDTISNFENIAGSNSSTAALNSDTISGNSSDNTIWGYAGNDLLYGDGEADYIDGGSDNDTIAGGDGADILYGGNGNDVIRANATSYTGTNTGDGDYDTVFGGAGQDFIYGAMDGDILYGNDASTIDGSDWLRYNEYAGGIIVDITANTALDATNSLLSDTVYGFTHVLASSSYNNTVYGNTSNNSIVFGSGNDEYYASNLSSNTTNNYGSDIVDMASGNDKIYFHVAELTSGDTINGGDGTDTLFIRDTGTLANAQFSNVSNVEIIQLSSTGTNNITLDKNDVTIIGGTLDDVFNYALSSFDSHDTINGSGGNDTLVFTSAGTLTSAMLSSVSNFEKIQLANGTNNVTVDISTITGASLVGGTGTDNFNYSIANLSDADIIDGGAGSNTLTFLDTGIISAVNFTNISNVSTIQLATGTNTLNIGTGYSVLGSSGDDIIIGGTGYNNTINAGIGNDTIKFALADFTSSDSIDGGSGTNTLEFTDNGTINSISGVFTNIQKIQFANGGNNITLDINGVSLIGGSGNDIFQYTVPNFSTTDILDGGIAGTDTLLFLDASTSINGANIGSNLTGIDIIQLANGVNTVSSYAYTAGTLVGGTGVDTITVTAGTNGAKINTGTGADIVNVTSVTDLNNSTIDGGAADGATDKIVITGTAGGTINATTVTNIDEIDLASGASPYTINTNISIVGSAGNDSIIGGAGVNNTISAGLGNDIVEFDVSRLTSSDVVYGGGQTTADNFKLTGTANDVTASMLSNVREFETLNIDATMTKNITLDSSDAGFTAITDSGINSQTIDVSAYAGLSSLTMGSTGAGGDTLIATSTQVITVTGGAGSTDTLLLSNQITSGGSIAALSLSNVERIQLKDGVDNNVSIDVSSYNSGNTSLLGGSGNDTFNYAIDSLASTDKIDGAGGSDTLVVTGTNTLADTNISGVKNIEVLDLTGFTPSSTITLGSTTSTNNSGLLVKLNSAAATTVNLSGFGSNITLTDSGSGNDIITASSSAVNNVITTGSGTANIVTIASANLDSGDSITMNGTGDTLKVTGLTDFISTDFNNISGVETLDLSTFTGATATLTGGRGKFSTVSGMSNTTNTIDASGITTAATYNLTNNTNNITLGSGVANVVGGSGVDTITINSSNLTSGYTLNGAGGTSDKLAITGNNVLSSTNFTSVSNIEILDLSNYGADITIDSTIASKFTTFTTKSGQTLTIDIANINGKTIDGAGHVVVTMGANSSQVLSGITASGTQTLKFTANATYSGALLSGIDVIDVTGSTTATLSALLITAKILTFSGNGNMIINADSTAGNNNFGSITDSISGTVSLNYSGGTALDLSSTNIGTTLINTFNTSSAIVTLSAAQAGNITSITGNGSLSVTGALGADLNLVTKGYTGNVTIADANGHNVTLGNGTNHITDNTTTANVITGGTGSDTVHVTSSVDVSAKTFSGIETLVLGANSVIIDSADAAAISTSITGNGNLSVTGALGANLDLSVTGKNYTGNVTIVNANGHDVTLGVGSDNITNTTAGGTLNAGAGNDTYNVSVATNIADTGDIDILNTTATMDLSGKVSGIDTLNVAFGTTTTLNYGDIGTSGISILSGLGSVSINGTTTMDIHTETVSLGADKLNITGTATADSLVLDFSQLDKIQFDGGAGTDTAVLNNLSGHSIDDLNAFTHVETFDFTSLTTGNLSISFDSLMSYANTSSLDLDTNPLTKELNLNLASANIGGTSITSSGNNLDIDTFNTNYNSWAISSVGDHTIFNGVDTLTLHVIAG